MKKVVIGIIVVVVLLLAGLGYLAWYGVSKGIIAPADFATKPWVEYRFGWRTDLAFDAPPELDPANAKRPPLNQTREFEPKSVKWHGMEVAVQAYSPYQQTGGYDELVQAAEMFEADPAIISKIRKDEEVLGGKGISLQLDGKDWLGVVSRNRILLFIHDNRLHEIHYNTLAKDRTGQAVWDRILKSLRRVEAGAAPGEAAGPAAGVTEPADGLPRGFKRR